MVTFFCSICKGVFFDLDEIVFKDEKVVCIECLENKKEVE